MTAADAGPGGALESALKGSPGPVRQWVSQYTVNATPEGRDQYNHLWDINVDRAVQIDGAVLWAVRLRNWSLSITGEWDFESQPSERTEEWLSTHRFELSVALRLARIAAPDVEINGRVAKDVR